MKLLFISICFLLCASLSIAQNKTYSEKDFISNPVWIGMIKDTAVIYFAAEKAFKIYFEHHPKPGGENERIGEHAKSEKHLSQKERRRIQEDNHMRMEIKKYERWHDRVFPYVKADGTVLTPSQRVKIWKENKNIK